MRHTRVLKHVNFLNVPLPSLQSFYEENEDKCFSLSPVTKIGATLHTHQHGHCF